MRSRSRGARSRWSPTRTVSRGCSPQADADPRLPRGRRLDAHLLAVQDVDRRAALAAQAARPPPHAANRDLPWATIDMDFMNLNQSAHGDREFGYMLTRLRVPRTTVVGHWEEPEVTARLGDWARAAAGVAEARRLRVCAFGDNMRQVGVTEGDKTEVQIAPRRTGGRLRRQRPGRRDARRSRPPRSMPRRATTSIATSWRRSCASGGARHASLREAAAIEVGLRTFLEAQVATGPSPTRSRTWGTCRSCPVWRSSG